VRTFLVRRLLLAIPTLIGASLLIFLIMRVLPGDVVLMILGAGGEGNPYGINVPDVERLRALLHLDRPPYEQYALWLWDVVRGDLGTSLRSQAPIATEVAQRLPVTLELAFLALLVSLLIAIPVGVVSALRQDSAADYVGRLFAIGGLSIPDFWLASLFLLLLVTWFRWIPSVTYTPFFQDPVTNLQQFLFPALALGVSTSASVARMLRSQLLEVVRQDYIRTAYAKGLRERTVVLRHAIKNAILPVVTMLGLRVGRLLGGTVILESIFNLPGVGRLLLDSISWRDFPVVQALVLIFTASFVAVNLLVDMSYAWLDPRVRY